MGCLAGTLGDKSQRLVLALANRFHADGILILAILIASAANAGIAVAGAAAIAPLLGADARLLFLALALLFMGVGMVWRAGQPDRLEGWRTGPFLTGLLGVFIIQFGDSQSFLTLGLAVHTGDGVLAVIGGTLGTTLGLAPVVIGREKFLAALPLATIRPVLGCVALLFGAACALSALRLL